MHNSKLLELYKTLNPVERKRFKQYVESGFFNANTSVIKLNQYITRALDSSGERELDKKKAHAQLFGKRKYSESQISVLMTFLMRLLEAFIAQLKYDTNKFLQKEYLVAELRKRKLDKHFISNTGEYHKWLQEKRKHDSEYYYASYTLEKEMDHFFMKGEIRKNDESLQRKSDHLDIFFLSEKLKNLCEMVNRQNIIKSNYNLRMLKALRIYIDENTSYFQTIPAVYIYYKILLTLLEGENAEHFRELKQSLDKYFKAFSQEEALQMYLFAQNYCIKKINSGDARYLQEILAIYETLLQNELIFEDNYLSQWDYKNIVSVGLKLGKFDWTKDFIENYKHRLSPESRENAYEYNLSLLHYTRKDYKSALKRLQHVDFTDVFYHLGAKSILLKSYYELEEVEPFYSLVDAYKVYLVRTKKISVYQRTMHQTLVKYTKQTFDLKLKMGAVSGIAQEKAIKKLKDRITGNRDKADFSWLLEKVDEL